MKRVSQTSHFSRDLKKMRKRGKDLARLREVVKQLASGKPLDPRHRDHALIGPWRASRDCHIEPDWVLIYTVNEEILRLERTGTNNDLFKK